MLENIRLSFRGIWSHKMRSFLTMLGIIIGIAAIIAIVSTIQGTNEHVLFSDPGGWTLRQPAAWASTPKERCPFPEG